MEKGLPAALSRIFSDIADNESKEQDKRKKINAESQRKKGLYDRISDLTNNYGVSTPTSVGTGAGSGIIGYRLETRSHLVTPPVEVRTSWGTVKIQIIERIKGGPNYSVESDGFSIQNEERTLFHIRKNGDAINWIGQEATNEERGFVSSKILDPLEKKLAKLPKPKPSAGRGTASDLLQGMRELRR